MAGASAGLVKLNVSYTPVRHPPLVPTGEHRPPRKGEWFLCVHLDCMAPDRFHRAVIDYPYSEREIYREADPGQAGEGQETKAP